MIVYSFKKYINARNEIKLIYIMYSFTYVLYFKR